MASIVHGQDLFGLYDFMIFIICLINLFICRLFNMNVKDYYYYY